MGYRFLIVDDSATTRAVIKRTIGLCGIEAEKIIEAGNGKDALAMLAVAKVDLVFLDINMPEMTGMEVAARIKADAKLCATPIVIVSSESMESRIQQMKAEGVRGYIKKPFTPEQIRTVINDVLGAANVAA